MAEIIPAIMPRDRESVEQAVKRYIDTDIKTIQIDLMDGEFVRGKTWPYRAKDQYAEYTILEKEGFPGWQDIDIELDLMVANPLEDMKKFIEYGPSRIVVHAHSVSPEAYLAFLQEHNSVRSFIHFGIAFTILDSVEKYSELLEHVDFVQCMGIAEVGKQGQEFEEEVLSQIQKVKELQPDMVVSIDGGVNPNTAEQLLQAGADRLVSGSFLAGSLDIAESIEDLGGITPEEI